MESNYSVLIKFLEANKRENNNIDVLINKMPELAKYWRMDPRSALPIVASTSAGFVYNPDTAIVPNFNAIPLANRDQLVSFNYVAYLNGTNFLAGFGGISLPTFMTKAMRVDQNSTFQKAFYIYKTDHEIGNGYEYTNSDPNGNEFSYWQAAFNFSSKAIVWSNNNTSIRLYNSGTSSILKTNAPLDQTKYFVFVFDGFNLWIGETFSFNDPSFIWHKIGNPSLLLTTGTRFAIRFGYFRSYTYAGTVSIAYTAQTLTGILPWN